jgi:hypothetical protein
MRDDDTISVLGNRPIAYLFALISILVYLGLIVITHALDISAAAAAATPTAVFTLATQCGLPALAGSFPCP